MLDGFIPIPVYVYKGGVQDDISYHSCDYLEASKKYYNGLLSTWEAA